MLRILLVTPEARGHGAGSALVDACVAHARAAGCSSITLWTNDVLDSARRIYEAAGFELVDRRSTTPSGRIWSDSTGGWSSPGQRCGSDDGRPDHR